MNNLEYNNQDFPVYVAKPNSKPKAGLIVIHEVWGLSDHIKDITDRFAKESYLAIAPNLLNDTDIQEKSGTLNIDLFNPETRNEAQPKLRELMTPMQKSDFIEKIIGKLQVCFDYLYNLPEVNNNVLVVGFCFGGSYSFNLAEIEPRLKAAVSFYGHSSNDQAKIDKIKCPILAFYGDKDEGLMRSLPEIKEKMAQANIDFTARVYTDTGHAFFNDANPYSYKPDAAQDSWAKTLNFLDKNIQIL